MDIRTEVILIEYLSIEGKVVGQYPHTLTYMDDKPASLSVHALVPTNLKRAQEIVGAFQYNRVKARLQLNLYGDPLHFMFGEEDIRIKDKTARIVEIPRAEVKPVKQRKRRVPTAGALG